MVMKKGFDVFVAIIVIVSLKVCTACFSQDYHNNVHTGMTGTQFVKDCVCNKTGYSEEHLTWLDPDGKEILPSGPGTTFSNVYTEIPQEGVVRLIVRSISQSAAGTYTCRTNFEGKTYTKTYKIEAYDNPYFVNTSAIQYAIIGEDSTIRCEVRSNTDHEVYMSWFRINGADTELLKNSEKYILLTSQGMIIRNVSKDDGGKYNCSAYDVTVGDMVETTINVQVAVRPLIYDVRFSVPPDSIVSGNNVTVECAAEGIPYPEYTWTKIADSAGNLIENASITWTQNMNAITFGSIQREDAGRYECTVENSVGSASRLIDIDVKVPPVITSLENVEAKEGSLTQIVCKASGVPAPWILMWNDRATELDEDGRITWEVRNTTDRSELYLSIINVSRAFEGTYKCSAENEVENVTQEMYLKVLHKPYFPAPEETVWGWIGKKINVDCDHESNPPSETYWKFQGNEIEHQTTTAEHVEVNKIIQQSRNSSDGHLILTVDNTTKYGEYECTAENDQGKSSKIIHLREAFKPESIRNVTVINMSATTVTFLIEGPDTTDNAPVNGFTAEYDLVQNYDIKSVHLSRTCGLDRNFTIDRLRPNSNYSIKFAAQNEVGVGVWSEYIHFVTPETSAPEPPILKTNVQNNHGKLRWDAPEANNDPIDHYSVEFCPFFGQVINTTLCQTENVSTTEFALDKLDRNTKYSFKIRAHNSHGYSDFTDEEMTTPEKLVREAVLSAGAIIGLSVVVVFLCLLVLDLLLLCWLRQGIIASCYFRKNKKKKVDTLQQRDKKGLLVREGADDSLTRPNNGHRELVYNKTTGVITGKHSTV